MSPPRKQSGVALITVMLVLALMVTVATQMSGRLQLDIARVINLQSRMQLQWFASGGEALVLKVLKQDLSDDDVVHREQYWASEGMVFPVEGAMLKGEVRDQQACFNLNALGQPNLPDGAPPMVLNQFIGLMVLLDVDGYLAEQIADATRDWIDADTEPQPLGAEDSDYEALQPPYVAANRPMVDVSEFRSVLGVSKEIYELVSPYLCALPESTQKLNVNTLTEDNAALLAAVYHPLIDIETAQRVIEDRPDNGFQTFNDVIANSNLLGLVEDTASLETTLGVSSNYFLAHIIVESEDGQAQLKSLIKRGEETQLSVIRRSWGGDQ